MTEPSQTLIDGVDVDAAWRAASACPGVAGLGSELAGAMTTYLPGRRLLGIRVLPDCVELEVRMKWDYSTPNVAAQLRGALGPVAGGKRIDVTFADIEVPVGSDPVTTATPASAAGGSDLT